MANNTLRLVTHGLRTLIKEGDRQALASLGYTAQESLSVDGATLDSAHIPFGGTVLIRGGITNS